MPKNFEIRIVGKKLFEYRSGIQKIMKDNWLSEIMGNQTASGKAVNEKNAMQVSAVWACIQILGNTLAMVPFNAYELKDNTRKVLVDDNRQRLIHRQPNLLMNSFTWRRTSMMQMAASGNSYSYIRRDPFSGHPVQLVLIQKPVRVEPFVHNSRLWFDLNGEIEDVKQPVPAEDILHFKWGSFDGLKGKSPLQIAKENIGQTLAMQEYASKIFAKGGAKRVAMEVPGNLNPKQRAEARKNWEENYAGLKNMQRLMMLEGGSKLVEVGMTPEEAQFVATMKFKIEEIARIYNVPLHLIQSLDHATNNNIEHQGMQFVTYSMGAHYKNIEEEVRLKLFPDEPEKYVKFNVNALMRGDIKTRAQYYRTMQDLGNYSINDVRNLEDEDPIDGGDVHYVQVNRMPIEQMNQVKTNNSNNNENQ